MTLYTYEGPVMKFDVCIDNKWRGETFAPSEAKARNNLAYRYKKENGLASNTRIVLPGKINVSA